MMFELAGLSTFLDIFQKALGLVDKHREKKRKLFTEVVEPVYAELNVVVNEYYRFFRGCRDEFSQADFSEFKQILDGKRKQREEIVLARNKVLGITEAFFERHYSSYTKSARREEALLIDFAEAISAFFYSSDDLWATRATSLFLSLDRLIAMNDRGTKEAIVGNLQRSLRSMEDAWQEISKAYGDLRVFCLSS